MMRLHLPASFPSDLPASFSMRDSVQRFYAGVTFNELTDGQAGDLLDYRDFARGVLERLAPKLYGDPAREAGEAVAVLISRDRGMATAVVKMMRQRFEKGADPDGLRSAVSRLPFFDDIRDHCESILP
jgi:hypothetical protein